MPTAYSRRRVSVETEAHPILCDDCGFSTFNQKQFNAHKQANCQSKAFPHQNDTTFKSPMRYNPAIKLEVGLFKCNKCGFNSDKPSEIREHVEKLHAEFQL